MEPKLSSEQRSLINEITAAFDGVPRGSGMTLQQSTWCGKWVYCERDEQSDEAQAEYRRMTAAVRDTSWQELADEEIQHYHSLSQLDSDGLRYYLPAFMIWTIRHYPGDCADDTDWPIITTLTSLCWHRTLASPGKWQVARWSKLNPQQRRIVCQFLLYVLARADFVNNVRQQRDIRHALDRYWSQFQNVQLSKHKKRSARK